MFSEAQEQMFKFLEKVLSVKNNRSVSAFARDIGMGQRVVDMYLKGERKPSLEFVLNICSTQGVSADWLLGLPQAPAAHTITNSPGAIVGTSAGTISNSVKIGSDCENCKYKRLAEALKAVQAD